VTSVPAHLWHGDITQIRVRVQERDPQIQSDLTWRHVAPEVAVVKTVFDDNLGGQPQNQPDLEMWAGLVTFAKAPETGRFRLLIEEHDEEKLAKIRMILQM